MAVAQKAPLEQRHAVCATISTAVALFFRFLQHPPADGHRWLRFARRCWVRCWVSDLLGDRHHYSWMNFGCHQVVLYHLWPFVHFEHTLCLPVTLSAQACKNMRQHNVSLVIWILESWSTRCSLCLPSSPGRENNFSLNLSRPIEWIATCPIMQFEVGSSCRCSCTQLSSLHDATLVRVGAALWNCFHVHRGCLALWLVWLWPLFGQHHVLPQHLADWGEQWGWGGCFQRRFWLQEVVTPPYHYMDPLPGVVQLEYWRFRCDHWLLDHWDGLGRPEHHFEVS